MDDRSDGDDDGANVDKGMMRQMSGEGDRTREMAVECDVPRATPRVTLHRAVN
jgi:hypothetical protein